MAAAENEARQNELNDDTLAKLEQFSLENPGTVATDKDIADSFASKTTCEQTMHWGREVGVPNRIRQLSRGSGDQMVWRSTAFLRRPRAGRRRSVACDHDRLLRRLWVGKFFLVLAIFTSWFRSSLKARLH